MSNDDPSLEDSPRNDGGEYSSEPAENVEDALDAILKDPSKKGLFLGRWDWMRIQVHQPDHRDGCLSPGLGCSSGRNEYRQSLVGRGMPEPYQPPGVVGCSSGSTDLHKGRNSVPCTPADG
jgi:hypothetical protein